MHDIVTLISDTSRTDLWRHHKTSSSLRITGERGLYWYLQLYIPFPLGLTVRRKGIHKIFILTAWSHCANTEHLWKYLICLQDCQHGILKTELSNQIKFGQKIPSKLRKVRFWTGIKSLKMGISLRLASTRCMKNISVHMFTFADELPDNWITFAQFTTSLHGKKTLAYQ